MAETFIPGRLTVKGNRQGFCNKYCRQCGTCMVRYTDTHIEFQQQNFGKLTILVLLCLDHGIVHRDLKFENIMFENNSPSAR